MSSSKVIWSSPEINNKRIIKNAKLLNDSSTHSLKFQMIFFGLLLFEIYFNLIQRIFRIGHNSEFIYLFICRALLVINIIYLLCYLYQIIYTKYTMIMISHDNKLLSIIKTFLFDIVPNLKVYHEKIVNNRIYIRLFTKTTNLEEEKRKEKLMEERRKMLTKSYFPSMMIHQQATYNERYIHRPNDSFISMEMSRERASNIADLGYTSHLYQSMDNSEMVKTTLASTPFSNVKVGSITFGGDITPIQSPGSSDNMRFIQHGTHFKHYSSSPSPPRIGMKYSPGGGFSNKIQSNVLTEVPMNEVWKRLGIDVKLLDEWTFSLRQWIHGTIVTRIVNEIDNLNRRFIELGITDVVIGESNVQTLRHLTNQQLTPFPSLGALINFLDCSKDQAYVVNRLKELSQGCSLGKFQWDSGSSSVRHAWKEHLPNDTMLILHMLCTYIEVRYTVHSNLHGVRTFSQQFITDNVMNKDINEMKDTFLLYQTSVQPPHFKVIFNQAIYEIPAGRKNLFQCLLVFFFKIYNNEGNFKWLNLGRSGMNINYIFDK